MKIKLREFELDTDEMAPFATGIPTMPMIYVNLSGAAFVLIVRRHWDAPKVRRLGRTEALRLADFCKLPELKARLTCYAPHGVLHRA